MIPARFHTAALEELQAEVSYYAEISPMLGEDLLRSVEQALQLACEFPEMGAPYKYGTRRVFRRDFHSRWSTCMAMRKSMSSRWRHSVASLPTGSRGDVMDNMSINTDTQHQEVALRHLLCAGCLRR